MGLRIDQWPPKDKSHKAGNSPSWKYKVLKAPIEVIARILYRPMHIGKVNLDSLGSNAAIFVSNHDTGLDPAYISKIYKYQLHILALDNPWWDNSVVRRILRELGVIAVPPNGSASESFRASYNILNSGCTVYLFPEANFMHDKRVIHGKTGFSRLAIHTGKAILPIGICGIDYHHYLDFLPPLNRKIEVKFGRPRQVKKEFQVRYSEENDKEVVRGVRDEVMLQIRELSNYAGVLPEVRKELIEYYKDTKMDVFTEEISTSS